MAQPSVPVVYRLCFENSYGGTVQFSWTMLHVHAGDLNNQESRVEETEGSKSDMKRVFTKQLSVPKDKCKQAHSLLGMLQADQHVR